MQSCINAWWPWLGFLDEIFVIQFSIITIYTYIYSYNSVFYILFYIFLIFFLIGISLSITQLDLFTAFLWLIECSVIFVFLILLFYFNIKNFFFKIIKKGYLYVYVYLFIFYLIINILQNMDVNTTLIFIIDNSYEAFFNFIQNDLFIFFISYYILNNVEFVIVGFLLLVGSILCVNLYQINKSIRVQSYKTFFNIFNFFLDMCSFLFIRRQNLIKQGNAKSALKIFSKK